MAKSKSQQKREDIQKDQKDTQTEEQEVETTSSVTYVGPGSIPGTYVFKEIAGTISATSEEEAKQKAEELVAKHPALLNR